MSAETKDGGERKGGDGPKLKREPSGFDFGGAVKARKAAGVMSPLAVATQEAPKLLHLHAFGAKGGIRDATDFLQETQVVQFVGQHVAVYNMERHRMQFFTRNKHVKEVLGMTVSPNFKFVALCERLLADTEKAQVSVYHVATRRKMRSMQFNMRGDFRLGAFSGDSKLLATYGGSPDANIVLWKWNAEKVLSTVRCSSHITRVRFNPNDSNVLTSSGPKHLRMWRKTPDAGLREVAIVPLKREQDNFVDHVWLKEKLKEGQVVPNERRMVAITDEGQALVFDSTDDEDNPALEVKFVVQTTCAAPFRLETIVAYNKGFCVAGSNSFLEVYERTDDAKDPFYRLNTFSGGTTATGAAGGAGGTTATAADDVLTCMAVSPSDETLVAFAKREKLQVFPLSNIDMLSKDKSPFEPMVPNGVHTDEIVGLDVCVQRPLLVSIAKDRHVRVWNYLTWQCSVVENLTEEPTSVAFHPSGFLLLIAFKEKLRAYNLLMKGVHEFNSLPLKSCHALEFSHGGDHFAAGVGIKVVVYETYTLKEKVIFDGHVQIPVRALSWSADDRMLCSCGEDGAVYSFSMDTKARIEELSFVHKQAKYTSVVVDAAKSQVLAAGSDSAMRKLQRGAESEEAYKADVVITRVVLDQDNTRLYAGTLTGAVRVYTWPLPSTTGALAEVVEDAEGKGDEAAPKPLPGGGGGGVPNRKDAKAALVASLDSGAALEFTEYALHKGRVTSLVLSPDGKYLFSGASDGSIFCLGVADPEAAAKAEGARSRAGLSGWEPAHAKNFNTEVALVPRDDFEDSLAELAAMQKKLADQESDFRYKLTLKESEWGEARAKLQEQMEEALTTERNRYEQLQARHESYVRDHMEERERVEADHVRVTQEVENQYEHKLALEMERYDALCEQVESMRQECEALLDAAEKAHESQVTDLKAAQQKRESELLAQVETLHENLATNKKEYEMILKDVEAEHEAEIMKKREQARQQLQEEKTAKDGVTAKLQSADGREKSLKKKLGELKTIVEMRDEALREAKQRNLQLEELLDHCARNLEEQRESIQDKEKQILNLRAGNRTLDNFRYVLDHRIAQLTQERGPIMGHVDGLEKHIREMYEELVREFQEKKMADRAMSNKDLKVEGLTNEVGKLRANIREKERFISSFQTDLERLVKATDSKDVEGAAKEMYRVFVKKEARGKVASKPKSHDTSAASVSSKAGSAADGDGGGSGTGSASGGGSAGSGSAAGGGGGGSAGAGGAGGPTRGGGGGDDSGAVEEVLRQREYMHKFAMGLKRKLVNKGRHMERNTKNRLAENSTLINECNNLRKTTQEQRLRIKQLETQLYRLQRDKLIAGETDAIDTSLLLIPGATPSDRGGGSKKKKKRRMGAFRTDTMGTRATEEFEAEEKAADAHARRAMDKKAESLRRIQSSSALGGPGGGGGALGSPGSPDSSARGMPSRGAEGTRTAPHMAGAGLWASSGLQSRGSSRGSLRPRSTGRIVRGSTRPLEEISNVRGKMSELLTQLDDNNREMDMQRREIRRLREQVHVLVHGAGARTAPAGFGGDVSPIPVDAPSESVLGSSLKGGGGASVPTRSVPPSAEVGPEDASALDGKHRGAADKSAFLPSPLTTPADGNTSLDVSSAGLGPPIGRTAGGSNGGKLRKP